MFKKIAVILFYLLIFYFLVFGPILGSVFGLPILLGGGFVFCTLITVLKDKPLNLIPTEIWWWFIFTIYVFIIGIYVASDLEKFITSYLTWVQYFIMMFCIVLLVLCKVNKNLIIQVMLLVFIFYVYYSLTSNIVTEQGRLTISEGYNSNAVGYIIVFGSLILLFILPSVSSTLFKILIWIGIVFSFYIVLQSGSRQSIIALLLMSLLWLCMCLPYLLNFKRISIRFIFLSFLMIITLLVFSNDILNWLATTYDNSIMKERLSGTVTSSGDLQRKLLYTQAMDFFKQNPLFGIGYDQFRVLSFSSGYSHSTYAEVLSNTGLIGCILWFTPYILIFKRIITLKMQAEIKVNKHYKYKLNIIFIMMSVIILFGFTTVHLYKIDMLLMLLFIVINLHEIQKKIINERIA